MFKKKLKAHLLASKFSLFISTVLLLLGVIYIINRQLGMGLLFISLGFVLFITLGFVFLIQNFSAKKNDIRFDLAEKDKEFLNLISKGKKNKAIKRCRVVESCSLKEAVDYVESIISLER